MTRSATSPGPATTPGARRAPRIGVTTYQEDASWRGWHRRASLVPRDYLDPLVAAGALPVLLPPDGGPAEAADLMGWLDALLLVGGPDVDPAAYGAEPDPWTTGLEPARDGWELALVRAAIEADIAVLGVCRGLQLLNVARGGTLRQHLDDPTHRPDGSRFGSVAVALDRAALPGAVLGTDVVVACYHHQAVEVLGEGLAVTGRSDDGCVESVQLLGRSFVVGVQWHPEVGPVPDLFRAFVRAAGEP